MVSLLERRGAIGTQLISLLRSRIEVKQAITVTYKRLFAGTRRIIGGSVCGTGIMVTVTATVTVATIGDDYSHSVSGTCTCDGS